METSETSSAVLGSDQGIRCVAVQGFNHSRPSAFDFPLSRAEKLQRVLLLYEAEANVTRAMLEMYQGDVRALRGENKSLRDAFRRRSVRAKEEGVAVMSADHATKAEHMNAVSDVAPMVSPLVNALSDATSVASPSGAEASNQRWHQGSGACNCCTGRGTLHASLRGTTALLQQTLAGAEGLQGVGCSDVRAVQELQQSTSSVTCLCFGQEEHHREYVLLAAASQDGSIVIYRCYRTEMETVKLPLNKLVESTDISAPPLLTDRSYITVHARLAGHTLPVTTLFFNSTAEQLITASRDKSVRFWDVNSGEMLMVFVGGAPVIAAAILPLNPHICVAANSNKSIHVFNVRSGCQLQTLRLQSGIGVLKFDAGGHSLLAGDCDGHMHVFEASEAGTLKSVFEEQAGTGAVTCICFVHAAEQNTWRVLCVSDAIMRLAECVYGPGGTITNLLFSETIATSFAPVGCCFSGAGNACFIFGSEDSDIHAHGFNGQAFPEVHRLKHHDAAVSAVAVNMQNTLLASADVHGHIVLWRRFCFRHVDMPR